MEQKKLSFELSIEHANVILAALSKQPYDVVSPVIEVLKTQASSQLQAEAPAVQAE